MKRSLLLFFLATVFLLQGQNSDAVDFTEGKIRIEVVPEDKEIHGSVIYNFEVNEAVDSLVISSRQLEISRVTLGQENLDYHISGNDLILERNFKKGAYKDLEIFYRANPEKAVYFPGWLPGYPSGDPLLIDGEGGKQVWTQGQGKYSSSWVPSFDDMNEKVKFSLHILFPSGYKVLANGRLKNVSPLTDNKTLWEYEMENPVSSYLLAFVAGNYQEKSLKSTSGTPISLYYYPSDSVKAESTYKHTKEIFDFLEREIGVSYPWLNYKQVPVRDFLYAGMENVTLTIFSDNLVTDSIAFTDRNYVNVNAHELAHHWFGNLVTEENGTHHWLQEGFATYYALLAEKHLFGRDYYYWKLYNTARQLSGLSEDDKGEALLDPQAGSLTFYEKGAWALHWLREQTGDKAFRSGIKEFLERYAFKNVNTDQFLKVMQNYTSVDLDEFRAFWLESREFPQELAEQSLNRNKFMQKYLETEKDNAPPVVVYNEYVNLLKSEAYYPLKQLVIDRSAAWPNELRDSLWIYALDQGDVYTRQQVAVAADSIGASLRDRFETLLEDDSYRSIQEALVKLWMEYPDKREVYLEKTSTLKGFEDRSFRVLWLALSLFTSDDARSTRQYFDELTAYTGPGYPYEVRQQAFNMLLEIGGFTKRSLLNLLQGLDHPAWQFSRYCRNMLDKLMTSPETRIQLRGVISGLDEPLRQRLEKRLEKVNSGVK